MTNNQEPEVSKFWQKIGPLFNIGLIVIGAMIVTGYLVVELHVSDYGIFASELVRVRYVTAGALLLLPVLVPILSARYVEIRFIDPKHSKWKAMIKDHPLWTIAHYSIRSVLSWGITVVLFLGAMFFFFGNWFTSHFGTFQLLGMGVLLSLAIGCGLYTMRWVAPEVQRRMESETDSKGLGFIRTDCPRYSTVLSIVGLVEFIGLILYVAVFIDTIFPEIPHSLGGGGTLYCEPRRQE